MSTTVYNFEGIDRSFSQGSNFLFQKQTKKQMFNFHQKREFNDISREPAYMLNKYQSVKNFFGMKVHSGTVSTECKIKQVFK